MRKQHWTRLFVRRNDPLGGGSVPDDHVERGGYQVGEVCEPGVRRTAWSASASISNCNIEMQNLFFRPQLRIQRDGRFVLDPGIGLNEQHVGSASSG
ncbi:hypothetical protein BH23GEM6_BH23GEM6_26460 [soil metagenome]